jgi:hypothetical protein
MVISGVAEVHAPKIRSIVFLDAFVPRTGEAVADLTSPAVQDAIRGAVERGETALTPRPAEAFGVNALDRAWVDRLCRPQPVATFTQKIELTGAYDHIPRKTYIRAKNYVNPGFDRAIDSVRGNASWKTYEAPCGHDVMVDRPDWLADVLLAVA